MAGEGQQAAADRPAVGGWAAGAGQLAAGSKLRTDSVGSLAPQGNRQGNIMPL